MLKNENSKIAKTLETAANIGIVVFVLAALGMLAKGHWLKSPEPKQISVGEQFALKNTNWEASGGAVVLGISTTCHFCTESAPFYRELVKSVKLSTYIQSQCFRNHNKKQKLISPVKVS